MRDEGEFILPKSGTVSNCCSVCGQSVISAKIVAMGFANMQKD